MSVSSPQLFLGDCVDVMRGMDAASIDLILTSPPYDNLRKYASGSAFDFPGVADQCKRLLKPGGVLVWVVGDETKDGSESGTSFKQALHFKEIGLRLHDTMIYRKLDPRPMSSPHGRYEQAFEFMFVFSKGRPGASNILREKCKSFGRVASGTHRPTRGDTASINGKGKPVNETKPRANVWDYLVCKGVGNGHPAVFPLQLAIDHILSWTNPGDTVLDCFAGSGTTLEACLKTGRRGIGIEKDPGYFAIAEQRISKAGAELPLLAGLGESA